MTKLLGLAGICAVLIVLASTGYCDVYPTVDFAFNQPADEYSWTVNYTADVNVYFNTFLVYAKVPALSWTRVSGPWSGSPEQDEGWTFSYVDNMDGTYALRWYADQVKQRKPSGGAWTGVFTITVPNSVAIEGNVRTYASVTRYLSQSSYVPQLVPEPSGIVALGFLAGLAPLVPRRKRK